MSAASTPTDIRKRLRATGYAPIPLRGKRPDMKKNWQWQALSDANGEQIEMWGKVFSDATNTGILTKFTPALDIDILHSEAAEAVEELVRERFENGYCPVRTGKAPKRAMLFHTDQPFKKITSELIAPDGSEQRLEFLADGQQLVVNGVHPETHRPYTWHGGEPGDIHAEDLTYITGVEAQQLVDDATALLIKQFGFQTKERPKPNGNGADQEPPPEGGNWGYYLDNLINHDALRDHANALLAAGMKPGAVVNYLREQVGRLQVEDIERKKRRLNEIPAMVRSGAERIDGDPNPGGAITLPFIDMSEWDTTPPPRRQWLVEDRIPLRQPTLLSGEGAIGKSILSLQLLVSTSLSRDWIGFSPVSGPTIYLGAEDEEDEIHRRLAAILKHYNSRFSDLSAAGFKPLAYAGKNAVLAELVQGGRIKPTELFKQLYAEARELQPKAIVIDTVSDVFLGDEIKRDQVRQFGSLMRRLAMDSNSAVILAAHPSQTGLRSGSGLSGSTQWHNTVRARAYFKKGASTDDEDEDDQDNGADDGQRELQFMKNQYGPLGQCIRLQWRDGLWLPVPIETASTQVNVEDLFIKLLQRFLIQGRNVSPERSPTYAPMQFAKQPEAKDAKVSSSALAAAMERLIQMNRVIIVKEGPPSRQRSRLDLKGPSA